MKQKILEYLNNWKEEFNNTIRPEIVDLLLEEVGDNNIKKFIKLYREKSLEFIRNAFFEREKLEKEFYEIRKMNIYENQKNIKFRTDGLKYSLDFFVLFVNNKDEEKIYSERLSAFISANKDKLNDQVFFDLCNLVIKPLLYFRLFDSLLEKIMFFELYDEEAKKYLCLYRTFFYSIYNKFFHNSLRFGYFFPSLGEYQKNIKMRGILEREITYEITEGEFDYLNNN